MPKAVQEGVVTIIWKPDEYYATSAHTEVSFTVWTSLKVSSVYRLTFLLIADII